MVMKKLLLSLFLLLFVFASLHAQSRRQQRLQNEFKEAYCHCLGEKKGLSPEEILDAQTEICILNFLTEKDQEIAYIIDEEYRDDRRHTEFEKGIIVGQEIVNNTIESVVEECTIYQQALRDYKKQIIEELSLNEESVKEAIRKYEERLERMSDVRRLAIYYSLLGVMYEFTGDPENALASYDKSLSYYPTTHAKGLRTLLRIDH